LSRPRKPLAYRLDRYIDRRGPDECWPWQGATVEGYPVIKDEQGKMRYVHRCLYEREIGPIPDELEVDHRCFFRGCCNHTHFEAVTPKVNIHRALHRRPDFICPGLRAVVMADPRSNAARARVYGVSDTTIGRWMRAQSGLRTMYPN